MKKCYKCKIEKELNNFYKDNSRKDCLCNSCKDCQRERQRKSYHTNTPEKQRYRKEYYKKYIIENREHIKELHKIYWSKQENIEKRRKYQRERRHLRKEYDLEYIRNRKKNDIVFRLKIRLRSRLHKVLNGRYKSGSAVNDLGCSPKELKEYLESLFVNGMSWDNYGEWHIDHIRPLCSFDLTNREQFLEACNYKNLQPLWAKDNLYKGAKLCCA
jgi:hypothetical protein